MSETGSMRPKYFTQADPTLDHQVVFISSVPATRGGVGVSCNCLTYKNPRNNTTTHHQMGIVSTLDESRELYNDPANHRKPFSKKDRAKW